MVKKVINAGDVVQLKVVDKKGPLICVEKNNREYDLIPEYILADYPVKTGEMEGWDADQMKSWEKLQKIVVRKDLDQIFPTGNLEDIIKNYTLSEIIQTCEKYDESKRVKFAYGDVVLFAGEEFGVLLQTNLSVQAYRISTGELVCFTEGMLHLLEKTPYVLTKTRV